MSDHGACRSGRRNLLGVSEATDALVAAYRPGRTFAQAFADFYAKMFAAQGLLVWMRRKPRVPSPGRTGAARGIERADEFHAASSSATAA